MSCLVPVAQVAGRRVATVESLGRPERLGPLQEAFLAEGAAQCGICTPGMLMTASAYLRRGGRADDGAIRRELAGNLCRCTGYQHIVRAVQKAARRGSAHRTTPTGEEAGAARAGAASGEPGLRGDAEAATLLRPRTPAEAVRLFDRAQGRAPDRGRHRPDGGVERGRPRGPHVPRPLAAAGVVGHPPGEGRPGHRLARHAHGPAAAPARAPPLPAAGRGLRHRRRRPDPEPRHDRRQRRERLAGGRHVPAARRLRGHGRRRVDARPARDPVPRVLHRPQAHLPGAGRARRGGADPAPGAPAEARDVPQGRHARRPGDLQDRGRGPAVAESATGRSRSCASPSAAWPPPCAGSAAPRPSSTASA